MKTLAHGRSMLVAALCWLQGLLWLWPRVVEASTLASDVKGYDWMSLAYAGGLGLLGGGLALIVALATDRRVVLGVLGEGLRNAMVSPIAGAMAYVGLEAIVAWRWVDPLAPAVRFLGIVGSGWAAIPFIEWVRGLAQRFVGFVGDWLVARAGGQKP